MTHEEQMGKWVEGESIHNGPTSRQGTCCPDFSCCRPELKWPEYQRRFFVEHPEARDKMLAMSLTALIENHKPGTKVYIAGDESNYVPEQ